MNATIDLDKIMDIALKGVRRTYVFLGFGINSAQDPNFRDYQLERESFVHVMPLTVPDETLDEFKRAYGIWIVGCGFNELIENYEAFLNRMYDACLLAAVRAGLHTDQSAQKAFKAFDREGIKGKLDKLADDMGIKGVDADNMNSFNLARNSLTHNHGRVRRKDCNDMTDFALVIKWFGMDTVIREPDGKEHVWGGAKPADGYEPIYLEQGGDILLKRGVARAVTFKDGEFIRLHPGHVAEICAYIVDETKATVASAVEYLTSRCGLTVERKQLPPSES